MKESITIAIDKEIFNLVPDYRRAVIVGKGIDNTGTSAHLQQLLHDEVAKLQQNLLIDDPCILTWQEAFRAADINPNKFRPSIDALTRRIFKGGELPSISPLVDIGTIISLRYLLPCGAHSLDDVQQELVLRRATGVESFTPFGTEENEIVEPGQIIFTDGDMVATSRWAWRQANHTIIRPETRSFELNIDALGVIGDGDLERAIVDARSLIKEVFGVETESYLLNESNPSIVLS